jgi:hypothetical protein
MKSSKVLSKLRVLISMKNTHLREMKSQKKSKKLFKMVILFYYHKHWKSKKEEKEKKIRCSNWLMGLKRRKKNEFSLNN